MLELQFVLSLFLLGASVSGLMVPAVWSARLIVLRANTNAPRQMDLIKQLAFNVSPELGRVTEAFKAYLTCERSRFGITAQ